MANMPSPNDILNEVLDSDIGTAQNTALGVRKTNYAKLTSYRNLTSYSMQEKLHGCPKLFELSKIGAKLKVDNPALQEGEEAYENVDFAFGHAVGAGVAVYDKTRDMKAAVLAAFFAWDVDLFLRSPISARGVDKRKSFAFALWALTLYEQFVQDNPEYFEGYEVVHNEANLGVDFENGYFYSGHIDTILRHNQTGEYKVKENKTTGLINVAPESYGNSEQALSYSLILDAAGTTEYSVLYTIYSSSSMKWVAYEFFKSTADKAEWLQDQLFISAALDDYSRLNVFPRRGSHCLSYNRPCQYFGSCNLGTDQLTGMRYSELPELKSLDELELIEHLDYRFSLSELVRAQKGKL